MHGKCHRLFYIKQIELSSFEWVVKCTVKSCVLLSQVFQSSLDAKSVFSLGFYMEVVQLHI